MTKKNSLAGQMRTRWLGLGGTVLAASLAIGFWPPTTSKAVPGPPPESGPVVAAGLVEPISEEIAVANLTQGVIKCVAVREGDAVKAGQVVAELNNDDLAAAVEAARAQVELRRGELEKLRNGARPEERREAEANLRDVEAALVMARLTLDRRTSLVERQAVSVEALDQARSNVNSLRARRDALVERSALINAPPRKEDVAMAEAKLRLAEANLEEAKAMLDKTFIRAPVDGTILRTLRRVGEAVAQTVPSTIVVMGDISRLRVRAEIDETDIGRVRPGQRAYAVVDAYRGQRFTGTIAKIASRMGRKAVHTEDPAEKIDAKVLDAEIDLDADTRLPIGLRVDVFVDARADPPVAALGAASTPDR